MKKMLGWKSRRSNVTRSAEMGVLLVCVLIELRCSQDPRCDFAHSRSFATKDKVGLVQWGGRAGELSYAVFHLASWSEGTEGEVEGWVEVTSGTGGDGVWAVLQIPGGERVPLPSRVQLFEVVDGALKKFGDRVRLSVFTQYMHSNPSVFSVEGLLASAGRADR